MCIRDRMMIAALAAHADEGYIYIRYEYPLAFARMQKAVEPVSYTHLRAHETVLDLVCRLLLEKKKHTNTTDECRSL